MKEKLRASQDERLLASAAHGSILLGLFTSGFGGIFVAMVIWLTQREKSAYVAAQALQALAYQVVVFLLTTMAFFCWGMLWLFMILTPLMANPSAYETAPPIGLWLGLSTLICPFVFYFVVIVYGLWAAVRCLGGHAFQYAFIGDWLERQ